MYKKVILTILSYTSILLAGLLIGYVAVNTPRWLTPSYTKGDFSAHYANTDSKIVLYGTQTCPYCKETRKWFNEKKIEFTEMDVQQNPEAQKKFALLDVTSVPVILIGQRRIDGFKPAAIEEALLALKK